jgi:hypothetical protein
VVTAVATEYSGARVAVTTTSSVRQDSEEEPSVAALAEAARTDNMAKAISPAFFRLLMFIWIDLD